MINRAVPPTTTTRSDQGLGRLAFLSMPRMEIELTSTREDGNWTWRAAGARQPKGSVGGSLVPTGAVVGDVLRVEVEQFMDGIEVTSVLADKTAREAPALLEILGSGGDEPLVTTRLAGKRNRRRDDDGPRGGRDRRGGREGGRGDRRRPRGDGDNRSKADSPRGGRPDGGDRRGSNDRRSRPQRDGGGGDRRPRKRPVDDAAQKPRAKRLRPRRTHRKAALAALPEDQKLLAQILLRDGVPGVRSAIEAQNKASEAAGEPPIPAALLLKLAERIHPALRIADWQDRAEAALAGIDDIDLRDLRSVVVAAEQSAKGKENKDLAEQIRAGLALRVDREQQAWLAEVTSALDDDRVVRALRLSSRPPKAGSPLSAPLLDRLATMAAAGLTADTSQDRWATVLDAVSLSPVHLRVVPKGLPAEPNEQLLAAVKRLSMSVPDIAKAFGIEPTPPPRARRGRTRS